jgi:hypothetical protein
MSDATRQRRAPRRHRSRPIIRGGTASFAVQGLETDRELIRTLARRLAEGGPASINMRASVSQLIAAGAPQKGRILTALRRSPLADADLQISRERLAGRRMRSDESE